MRKHEQYERKHKRPEEARENLKKKRPRKISILSTGSMGSQVAHGNVKTKNGLQKPHETPPKMVDETFVSCVYHFRASFKPILKNCIF